MPRLILLTIAFPLLILGVPSRPAEAFKRDDGPISADVCRGPVDGQRSTTKPALRASHVSGVTPRSRSLYFCTRPVGVEGSASMIST